MAEGHIFKKAKAPVKNAWLGGAAKAGGSERRWYPRLETEMRIILYAGDASFSAIMVDLSKCSIGVVSEKAIEPGTEMHFSIKYIEDFTIRGTVKWSSRIRQDTDLFRMGIETSSVLLLKEIHAAGLTGRSDYLNALLAAETAE